MTVVPDVTRKVTLAIPNGLHLAPISRIVESAGQFESRIGIEFDGKTADARSVYDLMLLAATCGAPLLISAEGDDAEEGLRAIAAILESPSQETAERS